MRSLCFVVILAIPIEQPIFAADRDQKPEAVEFVYDCRADREFITTHEYLKSKKEFGLNPDDMRAIALHVTKGCTGAAASFIESTELLLKTGIDGRTAITQSRDLAARGAKFAKSFNTIFRGAFAKEFLDMDSGSALRIARSLTTEFQGDAEVAANDYLELAKFCVETRELDLPRPECATMAARIASLSGASKMPVSRAFKDAVAFLMSRKNVNLTLRDALPLAESLVAVSSESVDRFKNAYDYASNKNGLNLTRADAIKFAKSVAENTKQKKNL
jgi:hypothetical protein